MLVGGRLKILGNNFFCFSVPGTDNPVPLSRVVVPAKELLQRNYIRWRQVSLLINPEIVQGLITSSYRLFGPKGFIHTRVILRLTCGRVGQKPLSVISGSNFGSSLKSMGTSRNIWIRMALLDFGLWVCNSFLLHASAIFGLSQRAQ